MKTDNLTALVRKAVVHTLIGFASILTASAAMAHPGHDHSHEGGAAAFFDTAPNATSSPKAANSLETIASNQLQLEEVFSQDSIVQSSANPFGSGIRIDFNDVIELNRSDLNNISTQQQQEDLFNLVGGGVASAGSDVLNVFFVDSISACGESTAAGIVGCASVGGNDLVVETAFAAGASAAELLAHELGHNLGLQHVGNNSSTNNLLNPVLNGNTTLTDSQAASLISNRRVNLDFVTDELFVTINPIIVGSLPAIVVAIPEPASVVGLLIGGVVLSGRRRRPA